MVIRIAQLPFGLALGVALWLGSSTWAQVHGMGVAKSCPVGGSACLPFTPVCITTSLYLDDFGDAIIIWEAFDIVDPGGANIRVPAMGNLPINVLLGNSVALGPPTPESPMGTFPVMVGPPGSVYESPLFPGSPLPNNLQDGIVIVRSDQFDIEQGHAGPLTIETFMVWQDQCNEGGAGCDPVSMITASSAAGIDVPNEGCPADLDGSGGVGYADLLVLLAGWGPCVNCVEDLDQTGDVGMGDLIDLLVAWGPCEFLGLGPTIIVEGSASPEAVCEGVPTQVTYTYVVVNTGAANLEDVDLVDSECTDVIGPSGDVANDGVLARAEPFFDFNGNGTWDPGEPFVDTNLNGQRDGDETWTYTCTMTVDGETMSTVTVTAHAVGEPDCAAEASTVLTVATYPTPTVTTSDATFCPGDPATVCADASDGTPPYTYAWTGPGGFSSDEECVVVESAGEYAVVVFDANGCVTPVPAVAVVELDESCQCFAADLDGSGDVGFADLIVLLADWGPCPDCPADLDGDGDVDFADLLGVLARWGPCG